MVMLVIALLLALIFWRQVVCTIAALALVAMAVGIAYIILVAAGAPPHALVPLV